MPEYMRDEYGKAYALPGPFYDCAEFASEARRRKTHYFDADTTRYFSARYHSVVAGAILVESVRHENDPRQYRLTVMDSRGHMAHVADPRTGALTFGTLRQAVRAAERVAAKVGAVSWELSDMRASEWGEVSPERQMLNRIAEVTA